MRGKLSIENNIKINIYFYKNLLHTDIKVLIIARNICIYYRFTTDDGSIECIFRMFV